MIIKLIIWDLDGVLVDSLGISIQNFIDAIKPYLSKDKLPSEREMFDNYLGSTEEEDVVKLAESKGILNDKYAAIKERFIDIKQKNLQKIPAFDGIAEIILYAKKKSINQALVTGRDKDAAYKILQNSLNIIENKPLSKYFDVILAGDDYPEKSKAFEIVKEKCTVQNKEILILGDETKDIQAAKQLGLIAGAAMWGTFSEKELLVSSPDIIFKKPSEVINFLKSL